MQELLEEVEQDEQACEAAARSLGGCRGSKRGGRSRRALPHSNSLQDLVAALAAEPTRRHHARHAAPAPTPSSVSARAIHGGSLPSGVDTCTWYLQNSYTETHFDETAKRECKYCHVLSLIRNI